MARQRTRIKGGKRAPLEARAWLTDRLRHELARDRLADVQLLVSEIVTNSIRHGGVGDDGHIELTVVIRKASVRVEVRDPGVRGHPAKREPDFQRGGGFGLVLVDRVASRWGVEHGSELLVWFELPFSSNSGPPPDRRRSVPRDRRHRRPAQLDRQERAIVRSLPLLERGEGAVEPLDQRLGSGVARRNRCHEAGPRWPSRLLRIA